MKNVTFEVLEQMLSEVLCSVGMNPQNVRTVVKVFIDKTKRGIGHHDINDFPSQVERVRAGIINVNPVFTKLEEYGCLESWDGDAGMGELTAAHAMERAIAKAKEFGMGMCTIRNSNHYLASSPYTQMAAEENCIGIIIAKDVPSMGVPGYPGVVVGQSPNGFAFPTGDGWPVMLDGCLAYVSGHGKIRQYEEAGKSIPSWWGVDQNGDPTTDPAKLMIRYPIGEHKGFGYAILCEMLTGVLSRGPVLDQKNAEGVKTNTVHTAIAIKADGLMSMEEFKTRSSDLIHRIDNRAPGVSIPGKRSHDAKMEYEHKGTIEISDELVNYYNERTGRVKPQTLFTENTIIGLLVQNEAATAVLDKYMPELRHFLQMGIGIGQPLKAMAGRVNMDETKKQQLFTEIRSIQE